VAGVAVQDPAQDQQYRILDQAHHPPLINLFLHN